MATEHSEEQNQTNDSEEEREMAKYGITLIPVNYFHVGNFRYTNLEDAVAEAKRQQRHLN